MERPLAVSCGQLLDGLDELAEVVLNALRTAISPRAAFPAHAVAVDRQQQPAGRPHLVVLALAPLEWAPSLLSFIRRLRVHDLFDVERDRILTDHDLRFRSCL